MSIESGRVWTNFSARRKELFALSGGSQKALLRCAILLDNAPEEEQSCCGPGWSGPVAMLLLDIWWTGQVLVAWHHRFAQELITAVDVAKGMPLYWPILRIFEALSGRDSHQFPVGLLRHCCLCDMCQNDMCENTTGFVPLADINFGGSTLICKS